VTAGPDTDPPGRDGRPDATPGVPSRTGDEPSADVVTPQPSQPAPAPPSRTRVRRPKVVLDSGFWVLLWVLGAILLIALIIVAVSQVSPAPNKGQGATAGVAVAPVVRPDGPGAGRN